MVKNLTVRMEKYRIRSLRLAINDAYSGDDIELGINIKYKSDYSYKDKSINCFFLLFIGGDNFPFSLSIEYEGLFYLNKRVPKKEAESLCKINCPAILFPFLRECVADVTRRAGLDPIILPSVNFTLAEKDVVKK